MQMALEKRQEIVYQTTLVIETKGRPVVTSDIFLNASLAGEVIGTAPGNLIGTIDALLCVVDRRVADPVLRNDLFNLLWIAMEEHVRSIELRMAPSSAAADTESPTVAHTSMGSMDDMPIAAELAHRVRRLVGTPAGAAMMHRAL